ncbi:uncharacterized protein TRIVIDRAFT_63786 [Trichoderma virens Gv29-8]|uniref:DUF6546 domain-containing protein n=1 Tax=Hypocrea virens (strain Gv29-8 / FGSC 10586) TaxID=413071 RepID=G9MG35_HYPVG|nr:uncharacterized protein TRIVIDRAFT_63786 [Trichoderma virens Gv29-8]EHK26485.1 hypothetical protein TRIVIDRAFT_63786 [Trichoderma virens Gv29-8]UKZ46666.1 hypothetical protein TrVGV298_000872 [Trichoderma virens]
MFPLLYNQLLLVGVPHLAHRKSLCSIQSFSFAIIPDVITTVTHANLQRAYYQPKLLPIEVQMMVLKLLQSHNNGGTTSNYAAVSKEWQLYFETFNFRRLILGQSCIQEFSRIVRQHRRGMVKHVWLRVKLARYLCPACEWPEKPLEIIENNQIFTAALYRLLDILSSWKKSGQHGVSNGGLVLELSAYSPSDSEHHFRYPLGKDDYPHKYDENSIVDDTVKFGPLEDSPENSLSEDNITHEFSHMPYLGKTRGACRLFGSLIKLDYRRLDIPKANRRLPGVSVVKGLLHRRRYPRSFHPDTLRKIFESLHGLENMMLEPLIQDYPCLDKNAQRGFDVFLRQIGSLKRLSIYGDHEYYGKNRYKPYGMLPSLGWTLADESHSLEHLSIAFLADAKDFFRDFWPGYAPKSVDISRSGVQRALMSHLSSSQRRAIGKPRKSPDFERRLSKEFKLISGKQRIPYSIYKPTWPNLESLALTSSLLDEGTDSESINNLLRAAAGAALKMPKLQIMEMFNERSSSIFIFQYCRNLAGIPTITPSSTWHHPLEPEVSYKNT